MQINQDAVNNNLSAGRYLPTLSVMSEENCLYVNMVYSDTQCNVTEHFNIRITDSNSFWWYSEREGSQHYIQVYFNIQVVIM